MSKYNVGPYLSDPNGHEHSIGNPSVIGRAIECDVVISSKSVSREHARIHQEGKRWIVEDLGSTNGTILNGEIVTKAIQMCDGDGLKIGDVTFIFHDPDTTTRENLITEITVDVVAGVVRVNRKAITLSPKEFQLLSYLYEKRGRVCSKDSIGHAVWPEYESGDIFDYQIENLVRRLRTRIEIDPANPRLLLTIRGLGYKLLANSMEVNG